MHTNITRLEKQIAAARIVLSDMELNAYHDTRFSELSVRQMIYLNTIISLGHPTFSDLAKKMNVSKPSVTLNVGALIRKGYGLKAQDHEDLRAYHIVPTPKRSNSRN